MGDGEFYHLFKQSHIFSLVANWEQLWKINYGLIGYYKATAQQL